MVAVSINNEILQKIPRVRLACLACSVKIRPSHEAIIALSEQIFAKIFDQIDIDRVSQRPAIQAAKEAYRSLGKDPSRYRPSAEALTRRIVKGKDLYWINNIVDILNMISLESGFSIGGYDADKIVGNVEFGVGVADEPYRAIGRHEFNIDKLPVFRDSRGAFGSPTSDSLRTIVTMNTKRYLMIIVDFGGSNQLKRILNKAVTLYEQLADVRNIETWMVQGATNSSGAIKTDKIS
jgi:DNA/RNA-binding domain of Phe-tRNA-synthetase-like protein